MAGDNGGCPVRTGLSLVMVGVGRPSTSLPSLDPIFARSNRYSLLVIPAKAGIQGNKRAPWPLDPGFRRDDGRKEMVLFDQATQLGAGKLVDGRPSPTMTAKRAEVAGCNRTLAAQALA